jgi:hypothetical protein
LLASLHGVLSLLVPDILFEGFSFFSFFLFFFFFFKKQSGAKEARARAGGGVVVVVVEGKGQGKEGGSYTRPLLLGPTRFQLRVGQPRATVMPTASWQVRR